MAEMNVMKGPTAAAAPGNWALFQGFLLLGLIGFGGVLPLARRMLVEERRWLSGEQFTELLGLCQFLPGGNIINLSVAVGMEFRGLRGACCALLGLICAPTAIVVALGAVYARFQNDAHVQHLFAGLASTVADSVGATEPPTATSRAAMPCSKKRRGSGSGNGSGLPEAHVRLVEQHG